MTAAEYKSLKPVIDRMPVGLDEVMKSSDVKNIIRSIKKATTAMPKGGTLRLEVNLSFGSGKRGDWLNLFSWSWISREGKFRDLSMGNAAFEKYSMRGEIYYLPFWGL